MDHSSVFHWCFIGAGTLAHSVANQIVPSGRHKISAVYTRNGQKCRDFASQFGGQAYDSAKDAVCAPDVDGVYVVTPHTSHFEYASLALSMGKPVLCEKPLTVIGADTEELFRLAKEKNVYLAEAMWTWFSPVARKVKEWVDSGEIGEIRHAEIRLCCDSRGYAPRCSDPNAAGGALLDIGVYPLTYLYRLFGNPVDVKCTGHLESGIDWWENIDLRFSNGLACTAEVSMCDPNGTVAFILEGSKGKIYVPDFYFADKAVFTRADGTEEVFRADGSYLNEFDEVSREIRAGLAESLLVPSRATADVMKIMDECRRQMGLVYPFEKQ